MMMLRRDLILALGAGALGSIFPRGARAQSAPPPRASSIIVLWMNGGPSHIDTWDPKPKSRTGGPGQPISTRLEGLQVSADMPRIADVADKLCVVRGMTSKEGNHQRAQYLGRTSYSPTPTVMHPSAGAWMSKLLGPRAGGLPAFVSLGGPSLGAGFLGAAHGPFVVAAPGSVPDNTRALVEAARFERRLGLLDALESRFSRAVGGAMVDDRRAVALSARKFMASPGLRAFDLSEESEVTRAAYGDTAFGRGCLTARRLITAGVRYVEVTLDGWDTHEDNFGRVKKLLGMLDPAMSALVRDLSSTPDPTGKPLLDSTLVVWMGDFGRSPVINARDGRNHHPQAFSAVLAGAGVRPGVVGATDDAGAKVAGKSYGVADLLATALVLGGISPTAEGVSPAGRPIPVTDGGTPIAAALG